jgi:hypothetical protein
MKPTIAVLFCLILSQHSFGQKTFKAEGVSYATGRFTKYYTFNVNNPDSLVLVDSTLIFHDKGDKVIFTIYSDPENKVVTEKVLYSNTRGKDSFGRMYENGIIKSQTQYKYDSLDRIIRVRTKHMNESPRLTKTIRTAYHLESDSFNVFVDERNGKVEKEEYDYFSKKNLYSRIDAMFDTSGNLVETIIRNKANGKETDH